MFKSLTTLLAIASLYTKADEYPSQVYVVQVHSNTTKCDWLKDVYESESDALKFCDENTGPSGTSYYTYYSTMTKFIPPSTDKRSVTYPNYVYPMTSTDRTHSGSCSILMDKTFVDEKDASQYCSDHNNENVLYMYGIQYYHFSSNQSSFFNKDKSDKNVPESTLILKL